METEPFTLIFRRAVGINSLNDLAGKQINLDEPGSPVRCVMEMIMKAEGWTRKSSQFVEELSEAERLFALCHNRVQMVISVSVAQTL